MSWWFGLVMFLGLGVANRRFEHQHPGQALYTHATCADTNMPVVSQLHCIETLSEKFFLYYVSCSRVVIAFWPTVGRKCFHSDISMRTIAHFCLRYRPGLMSERWLHCVRGSTSSLSAVHASLPAHVIQQLCGGLPEVDQDVMTTFCIHASAQQLHRK